MSVLRNTSGQGLYVYAHDTTADAAKTGDAANITAKISLDGGAYADTNDLHPDEIGRGVYWFALTQAETDAGALALMPVSATAGIVLDALLVLTQEAAITYQSGDAYARLGAPAGASVSADIAAIEAQTDDIGAAGAGLTALQALVWAYASRTLTQPAASVLAAVTGSTLNVVKSRTYDATLTGLTIQAAWTGVKFTAKTDAREPDAASLLQVTVSNPATPTTDGVLYVQGAAATPAQRLQGSLTVDQGAGTVALHLQDDLTAALALLGGARYDITQYYTDGGETKSTQLTRGVWTVSATETGALA